MNVEFPQECVIKRLPDKLFDVKKLDRCYVKDMHGQAISIKDIRKNSSCIFVFIRHFLDYATKEYVEDFSKIFPRDLKTYGVKIIAIGCAPPRFIQSFCDETNFCHEMYCDSKRLIYNTLSLKTYPETFFGGDSPHIKSNFLTGFFTTMWKYIKSTVEQGDPLQQGGQLVIDKDGKILFFHRDLHPLDHTPINDLLEITDGKILFFHRDLHPLDHTPINDLLEITGLPRIDFIK